MRNKHPTLGKKKLASMYFLTRKNDIAPGLRPGDIEKLDLEYPTQKSKQADISLTVGTNEEYVKFKNTKWVFHGISKTKVRFSNINKTRIAYLLNPTDSSPIITAVKYILPLNLREVHAFHPKIEEVKKFNFGLALLNSSKTSSLKQKLFVSQKGLCKLCDRPIE